MLIQIGLLCILNAPLGYAVGVPFVCLVYVAIVAAEEEFLAARFGAAYADYCRRVPRFVPRLAGLGATLAETQFEWRRLVRKEYGSAAAWMTWACALVLWKAYRHGGGTLPPRLVAGVAVAWGCVVLGWTTARILKKSGRLG
jgi:hypothetical protein